MRAIHAVTASVMIVACGGSSARPAAEPSTPTSTSTNAATDDPQDPQEPPPVAASSDEPVSWTLFQPMSIDRDGVVTVGGRVWGTLSAGALVGPDGAAIASVDADGYVTFEGRRRDMRISGLEVHEHPMTDRDERSLRIEGDELVLGNDEERVHVEHLRPERIADVLLVSTAAIVAMAAAYQH
jgi:hypothetical protein